MVMIIVMITVVIMILIMVMIIVVITVVIMILIIVMITVVIMILIMVMIIAMIMVMIIVMITVVIMITNWFTWTHWTRWGIWDCKSWSSWPPWMSSGWRCHRSCCCQPRSHKGSNRFAWTAGRLLIPCSRTCNQRGSCVNNDNGNDNLTHGSDNDNNHGSDNDNNHGNDNDKNHGNHNDNNRGSNKVTDNDNNRGSNKVTDNDNSSDNDNDIDNGNQGCRQKFRTPRHIGLEPLCYVNMVMEKHQKRFQNQGGSQKISGPWALAPLPSPLVDPDDGVMGLTWHLGRWEASNAPYFLNVDVRDLNLSVYKFEKIVRRTLGGFELRFFQTSSGKNHFIASLLNEVWQFINVCNKLLQ